MLKHVLVLLDGGVMLVVFVMIYNRMGHEFRLFGYLAKQATNIKIFPVCLL